jgi:hypothetical protein
MDKITGMVTIDSTLNRNHEQNETLKRFGTVYMRRDYTVPRLATK